MIGLLRANFARLWKTKAFWGCVISPAAFGIMMQLLEGRGSGFFRSMYNATPVSLFFSAIFTAMYIGTDNSDRTVHNKLIAGIPRFKVYFANLITVSVGVAVIFAVNWISLIIYDVICGGWLDMDVRNLVLYAVLCLVAGAAMAAVCTLTATLVSSRSKATALAILLTIGMLLGTPYLMRISYSSFGAEVVYKLLPTSQISMIELTVSLMDNYPENHNIGYALEPMWYSLGLIMAATVVGVLAFRKKDLK